MVVQRECDALIMSSSPYLSDISSYRILKRRIAWMLGKSAPEEELARGVEPSTKIWELLGYLIQDQTGSSDVAVRLSAALAIRERADVCGLLL